MTKNEPNVFLSTSFGKQNLSCKGRGVAEKNVLRIYMYNVCIYIQGWIKDLARGVGGQNLLRFNLLCMPFRLDKKHGS